MKGSGGEELSVCFEGGVSFPAAGPSDGEVIAAGEASTRLWAVRGSLPAPRSGVQVSLVLALRMPRRLLSPVSEKDKWAI